MSRHLQSGRHTPDGRSSFDAPAYVYQILCNEEEDASKLEQELADLVELPVSYTPTLPKTHEDSVREELKSILRTPHSDMKTGLNQKYNRLSQPKLAESATSGCSEKEKRCIADAVQVDLTTEQEKQSIHFPSASAQNHTRTTRIRRILALLEQRRQELRLAAYQAQQVGEMELSKRHLTNAQQVTTIMRAVENNIPFNLAQLPTKPSLNSVFSGPVLGEVTGDVPPLIRLDLEHAADPTEQEQVLISILKRQVSEAMQLAQEQARIRSMKNSEQMTAIANSSQSTISMLTGRPERPVSLVPQFRTATLPVLNKNADLKDGIVEVVLAWGVKSCALNISDTFHLPASQIQVCYPHFSETDGQEFYSSKVPFINGYSRGHLVQELRIQTGNWFVRRMTAIRLNLYVCDIKDQKSNGRLLETLAVPLRDLEQLATAKSTFLLQNKYGVVNVTLRHRLPINGSHLTTRMQPWLCVTVLPVVPIRPVSSPKASKPTGVTSPTKTDVFTRPETNTVTANTPSAIVHIIPKADRSYKADNILPTVRNINHEPLVVITTVPVTMHCSPSSTVSQNQAQMIRTPTERYSRRSSILYGPKSQSRGPDVLRVEPIQSRALLRSQERFHESRIRDPGLTDHARNNHYAELKRTRASLAAIDRRLSGPNAASELRNYVKGLENLRTQLETLSKEAKRRHNTPAWTGYQHKLIVVTEEIKSLK